MLESLATTSVHCWFTHARLVRKLHGSVYLGFKWLLLVSKGQISIWHICLILKLALYKYHIIIIIVLHQSQMIINIVEFTSYESFSII